MVRVIPITRTTFKRCPDPPMGIEPTPNRQDGFDKSAGLQIWTAQPPSRSKGESLVTRIVPTAPKDDRSAAHQAA
jgi:hypothetical protein